MTASSDLFDLVKSLSKSEKRYFRMYAELNARSGGTKYLQLFDMIDAQQRHDDTAAREAFAARFPVRHFSEAKYYLYKVILRALHAYAAERSADVQITMMLHQASILFDRKLFRQSEKLLARAREQAVQHELWHLAAEARRQEYTCVLRVGGGPDAVRPLLQEMSRFAGSWRDKLDYWSMYSHMLAHVRYNGMPRNRAQLAAFVDLLNGDTDVDRHSADSPSNAINHRYSIAICREAAGDHRGAIVLYREMLPIVLRSVENGSSPKTAIAKLLCNLCMASIDGYDAACFHEFHPMLLEHAEDSPRSVHFEARLVALALPMSLYIYMGEYRRALEAAEELHEAIARASACGHVDVVRRSNPALLLLAAHFGLGEYDRCIDYINEIIGMLASGLPVHHYGIVRIYQLMVHFERGDFDLLEHLLRSAHRYFVGNRAGYQAEEIVIAFIKRALRSHGAADTRDLFAWLLEEIAPLRNDPFESIFLHWIDLVPWLESKVHGRPYAELVREAFRARSEAHGNSKFKRQN